jgi:hypothetical protein
MYIHIIIYIYYKYVNEHCVPYIGACYGTMINYT